MQFQHLFLFFLLFLHPSHLLNLFDFESQIHLLLPTVVVLLPLESYQFHTNIISAFPPLVIISFLPPFQQSKSIEYVPLPSLATTHLLHLHVLYQFLHLSFFSLLFHYLHHSHIPVLMERYLHR